MAARQRRVTVAIVLLGIAVLVGAAMLLEEPIREQWLIWRLEDDSFETRKRSALELGEIKSIRAVPAIVQLRPPPDPSSTLSRSGDLLTVFSAWNALPFQSTEAQREELYALLADRIGPLERGQVLQKGPDDQFLVRASPYVTTRVRLEVEALNIAVAALREGGPELQNELQRLVDREAADASLRAATRVILRALKNPRPVRTHP